MEEIEKETSENYSKLEMRLDAIENELEAMKTRNIRVEGDKAWEVSTMRISFLFGATYLITAVVFYLIGVENFFRNALIPSLGYLLSVQTLPILKSQFLKKRFLK